MLAAASDIIDPIGTPEIRCTDLAYMQMASSDVLLLAFMGEHGFSREDIVKVKLLFPIPLIASAQARVVAFIAAQAAKRSVGSLLLM